MTPKPPRRKALLKKKTKTKNKKQGAGGVKIVEMLLRPKSQNAESCSFIKTLQIGLGLKPL